MFSNFEDFKDFKNYDDNNDDEFNDEENYYYDPFNLKHYFNKLDNFYRYGIGFDDKEIQPGKKLY